MLTNDDLGRIEELTYALITPSPQDVLELVRMARRYLAVQTHFLVRDDENTTYFDDPAYFQTDEDLDRAVDKFINSQRKEGGEG